MTEKATMEALARLVPEGSRVIRLVRLRIRERSSPSSSSITM